MQTPMAPSLLAAALPLLILLTLLLLLRRPLMQSAPVAFLCAVLTGHYLWQMPPSLLLGATLRGTMMAVDLTIIIFGALFFLEFLKATRVAASLQHHLVNLSPDARVQAVLIAWLFSGFLEGSAGFGTPGAIVAPLLVAIGFPVLTSIFLALLGNSTAVAFGAVGTPIRVGLSAWTPDAIAPWAAGLSLLPGLLIPVLMVGVVVQASEDSKLRRWTEMMPWAIGAGLAFLIPFFLLSFVGPEFPSLLGAPIALIFVGISLKKRWLLPNRSLSFGPAGSSPQLDSRQFLGLKQSAAPYALLISVLLFGKWLFNDMSWMLPLPGEAQYRVNLFNPGFAFLSVIGILFIASHQPTAMLRRAGRTALNSLAKPFSVLFFVGALVQVMMLSEQVRAHPEAPGMISTLARGLESPALLLFAPAIGALGSFLAGSATVSNLLLGGLQFEMAESLGFAPTRVLGLQLVGAAAGNMIALPNILAVQATVNQVHREREIIFRLLGPCLLYLAVAGVLGHLLLRGIP